MSSVLWVFMADATSPAGEADSSMAPGLTSGIQWSMNASASAPGLNSSITLSMNDSSLATSLTSRIKWSIEVPRYIPNSI